LKLVTYQREGSSGVGLLAEEGIIDLSKRLGTPNLGMRDLIARWSEWSTPVGRLQGAAPDFPLERGILRSPVEPRSIFAIGLNYGDHCLESGLPIPTDQVWFSKGVNALNDPYGSIELPTVSEQLDYECELVMVIGRKCRNVPRARAKEVIFGFMVGNDVSVRDWQLKTGQWLLGKSFDSHAPVGPWITTTDAVDPHRLDIRTLVNAEVRQHSNTENLVFDCYAQIEHLTKVVTLHPGDLVFTGTCGGVGAASKPPRWLRAGDVVRVEIDGLGAIEHRVRRGTNEPQIGI